jgi:hypothetical protein
MLAKNMGLGGGNYELQYTLSQDDFLCCLSLGLFFQELPNLRKVTINDKE